MLERRLAKEERKIQRKLEKLNKIDKARIKKEKKREKQRREKRNEKGFVPDTEKDKKRRKLMEESDKAIRESKELKKMRNKKLNQVMDKVMAMDKSEEVDDVDKEQNDAIAASNNNSTETNSETNSIKKLEEGERLDIEKIKNQILNEILDKLLKEEEKRKAAATTTTTTSTTPSSSVSKSFSLIERFLHCIGEDKNISHLPYLQKTLNEYINSDSDSDRHESLRKKLISFKFSSGCQIIPPKKVEPTPASADDDDEPETKAEEKKEEKKEEEKKATPVVRAHINTGDHLFQGIKVEIKNDIDNYLQKKKGSSKGKEHKSESGGGH